MEEFLLQLNKIKSGQSRPYNIEPTNTRKVGVLGSGMMGHGIAYITSISGLEVIMTDSTQEYADKGFERIKSVLINEVNKGNITEKRMKESLQRITPTDNYHNLAGCDLIIEAVFEKIDLKEKVIIEAESLMDSTGIFASNTSTIPISQLAKGSSRPNNFIGIHFFSPVHKMKLVEIIKGENTSPLALAKAFDYVLKIGKIPIVVNDGPGFYTTRVFEKYTCEGLTLLYEGQRADLIETAGKEAGFPVGPLAILDEISIALAAHIRNQTSKDIPKQEPNQKEPCDKVIDLMINKAKRTGRHGGGGFYDYYSSKKKSLWTEIHSHFPPSKIKLPIEEIIDRYYFSQALETIRCYEEGIITSVADANIGSVFGWGFPSFKGGTLQFVNDYGVVDFRNRAQELAEKYGNRFLPPKLLKEMANSGKTF